MTPPRPRSAVHLLVLTALLLLTAALSQAAPALAAAGWSPAAGVAPRGVAPAWPRVEIDAAGNAVAVWEATEGGKNVIKAASRPAGGGWQAPLTISAASAATSLQPRLAIDPAGDAIAAWRSIEAGVETVQTAIKPAGAGWQAPAAASPGFTPTFTQLAVAIDPAGDALAVWDAKEGSLSSIQAATRPAGGGWSAPQKISPATNSGASEPLVAVDAAGNALAVWKGDTNSGSLVQAAAKPAGGAWQAAQAISPLLSFPFPEAKLAVNAKGDAIATWADLEGGEEVARAASRPAGGAWAAAERISPLGVEARTPGVAIGAGGEALAFWGANSATNNQDLEVMTRPAGGAWTAPAKISTMDMWNWPEPDAAFDADGRPVIAWSAEEEVGTELVGVIQASAQAPDGSWPLGSRISTLSKAFSYEVQLALDAAGDGVAIWTDSLEQNEGVVESALYDTHAPLFDSASIPAAGTAGTALGFAAAARDPFSGQVTLSWSFGDGASASGAAVSHAYAAAGSYPVTVTATDPAGNTATRSGTVTVAAAPGPKPKPSPGHGTATAARSAPVKGARATLSLSCAGDGPCAGALTLKAKARVKGRTKLLTIGKASFKIAAGARATVKVKLSGAGRRLLAAAGPKGLKARVSGSGVRSGTVVLRPPRRR